MAFQNGRRQWVKLWTQEWLGGTMRFQMTAEQRGLWADFLALAGASRTAGVICAGETKGNFDAYPLDYLASWLRCSEQSLREAIALFEAQDHIQVQDGVIYISNWKKYQSEYQRQKAYRKNEPGPNWTENVEPLEDMPTIKEKPTIEEKPRVSSDLLQPRVSPDLLQDRLRKHPSRAMTEIKIREIEEKENRRRTV